MALNKENCEIKIRNPVYQVRIGMRSGDVRSFHSVSWSTGDKNTSRRFILLQKQCCNDFMASALQWFDLGSFLLLTNAKEVIGSFKPSPRCLFSIRNNPRKLLFNLRTTI